MNSVAKYQFTNMYYVANTVLNMNNYNELSICKYFNALRMKKKTHRITNIIKAIISGFFFFGRLQAKVRGLFINPLQNISVARDHGMEISEESANVF